VAVSRGCSSDPLTALRRPLAEGAVLKKRFDDIFAATKYTKALEAIRKLKTEQAGRIKEMKPTLDKLKNLKDQAHKLKSDLGATEAERAKHMEDLQVLQDKAVEKEVELGKCQEILSRLQALHQELSVLKARRDTTVMEATRRKEALTQEIAGSTLEDLLKLQQSTAERANKDRADISNLEHELVTGRAEWQHLGEQFNREVVNSSRLQTEADMQSKRVTERQNTVKAIAERHPAIGMHFTTQPTAADVQTFEQKVRCAPGARRSCMR
jgi:DNA repair protein RAD50